MAVWVYADTLPRGTAPDGVVVMIDRRYCPTFARRRLCELASKFKIRLRGHEPLLKGPTKIDWRGRATPA